VENEIAPAFYRKRQKCIFMNVCLNLMHFRAQATSCVTGRGMCPAKFQLASELLQVLQMLQRKSKVYDSLRVPRGF
jgi:hypothetical protein